MLPGNWDVPDQYRKSGNHVKHLSPVHTKENNAALKIYLRDGALFRAAVPCCGYYQ
jgi:hypothetical protein